MWERYRNDVQFVVVYLREAHAIDGPAPIAGPEAPIVEEPLDLEERRAVASVCMTKLALEPIPAVVDAMDDGVGRAYDSWPDRLYLIGRDGTVTFQGERGPYGFDPEQLERAIRGELGI